MSENNEINQIIRQAKEDSRNENLRNFLVKNGKILSSLVILLIVVAIGFFVFDSYQKSQQDKYTEILQKSLMDQSAGDLDSSKDGLKQIIDAKSAPKNIRALALLRYAGMLLQDGQKSQALEFYQEVNKCSKCDPYIKDLGGLLAVKIWISDENEVKKEDLLSRIEKIESSSKELRYQISEQKAIYQMQRNNLKEAYVIFESLAKNPEVDSALKSRFEENLKIVISKGYNPKDVKKSESEK